MKIRLFAARGLNKINTRRNCFKQLLQFTKGDAFGLGETVDYSETLGRTRRSGCRQRMNADVIGDV